MTNATTQSSTEAKVETPSERFDDDREVIARLLGGLIARSWLRYPTPLNPTKTRRALEERPTADHS